MPATLAAMKRRVWRIAILALLAACGSNAARPVEEAPRAAASEHGSVVLSVVGTNDLHGHLGALPIFAGHLANLRAVRQADGGAVVLVDGGDMFQGTLESNLEEGAPIVRAYAALGYDAVTIGNHEFDYGPVGERSTPGSESDDPRGALRARIADAPFPFLSLNVVRRGQESLGIGELPSTTIERAGVRIAILGVTTEATLHTTIAANVADLEMRDLATVITSEAAARRAAGADVVIVAAHAGGSCTAFTDPDDLSSCTGDQEIFEVARRLPQGAVDVIVAGHTHRAVAHRVNGIAIIESHSYGRAFGRVDLTWDRDARRVREARLFPPHDMCTTRASAEDGFEACAPASYEGSAVLADARLAEVIAPAIESARGARERSLGAVLAGPFTHDREEECPLGNLFVDLMHDARPDADVVMINGGGLRADLPEGPLTYGELYEAMPFDNRFARVRTTGAEVAAMIGHNLERDGSFFSIGGVRVTARCEGETLHVELARAAGRAVRADEPLTLLTSDFLATGGDGFFAAMRAREGAVTLDESETIRDAMAQMITRRGGTLAPEAFFSPQAPRVRAPTARPVRCH